MLFFLVCNKLEEAEKRWKGISSRFFAFFSLVVSNSSSSKSLAVSGGACYTVCSTGFVCLLSVLSTFDLQAVMMLAGCAYIRQVAFRKGG